MNPIGRMNATFAAGICKPGRVGFISQSGALLTAILDWAAHENVGFSSIVSLGSMLDVGWGDVIDYLGNDPNTDSIVIYMETIGDARAFLSAAREVALSKPIIVIKPGRTVEAAKAAASHTGSLTGSDDVLDAAFRRAGVLRVDSISELFEVSEILAKQPRPKGRRLSIVTNAGGPGVIATDALIGGGGELSDISPETMEALNAVLPAVWSHNNPIDIIGDAPPDRYAKALEIAATDPETDGLLVILTPQAMTDPTATARALVKHAQIEGKPVLASWMGGEDVAEGARILREAGIPTFAYPDTACVLFNHLWRYDHNLRSLYETPRLPIAPERGEFREEVDQIIADVSAEGRTLLTEYESKKVLAAYGIPITDTELAQTEDEAVAGGGRHGLPGRRQAPVADDHPQDRRRRRHPQPAHPGCRPRGLRQDPGLGRREGRGGALRGRHDPADDQLVRLRADRGQQPRPAVRPGPAVRHGRPAGRGLQGPRPGPAAAQHDARPAAHPRDDDLPRAQGRPRPQAHRQGRRSPRSWCASASSSRSSRASRRSTSTRCWRRRSGSSPSTRAWSCTRRRSRTRTCRASPSARTRTSTSTKAARTTASGC